MSLISQPLSRCQCREFSERLWEPSILLQRAQCERGRGVRSVSCEAPEKRGAREREPKVSGIQALWPEESSVTL